MRGYLMNYFYQYVKLLKLLIAFHTLGLKPIFIVDECTLFVDDNKALHLF